MTDIVEVLRSKATDCHVADSELYYQAADEIERLRADFDALTQAVIDLARKFAGVRVE